MINEMMMMMMITLSLKGNYGKISNRLNSTIKVHLLLLNLKFVCDVLYIY